METWDSVPVKNFIFPVLHLRIVMGNDVKKFLDIIDSDVENLSIGEEVARNTLLTLNQVITKIRKNAKYGLSIMV